MSIDPGWYHAEGDPPNTVRYWNGAEWQGGPQAPPAQGPGPQVASASSTPQAAPSVENFAPTPADQVTEPQTPPPAWGQAPSQESSAPGPATSPEIQPGWYPAAGDPPNTIRYWNGQQWQGGPRSAVNLASGEAGQLGPLDYVKRAYTSRFADFSGRARRAEFGWFILVFWIAIIVLAVATGNSDGGSFLGGLLWLASLVPYLSVSVRRLHDLNISGWAMLAMIIPLVNMILFLVMLFSDSRPAPNQWGRSPKYG